MAKYVENFNEWAFKMYEDYAKVSKPNRTRWAVGHYNDGYSIITTLIDLKKGECSSAKVSRKEYNEKLGIGVAWARLRGYEVPKERKRITLENLADYDKFSVVTLENIVLIKIGNLPETEETAVYDIKRDMLCRLDNDTMVYKIN